jgi:hypothetical protein
MEGDPDDERQGLQGFFDGGGLGGELFGGLGSGGRAGRGQTGNCGFPRRVGLTGGDDNEEVNFNTFTFGGDATWYLNPKVAVEAESAFGLGTSQEIFWKNTSYNRIQMPHTLQMDGNLVFFPGGSTAHLASYVTGGIGTLTLFNRTAPEQLLSVTGDETFLAAKRGGGRKIFRRGDYRNWGFRIDYRLLMIRQHSGGGGAVPWFAQNKGRMGHRFYIGMLYTLRR